MDPDFSRRLVKDAVGAFESLALMVIVMVLLIIGLSATVIYLLFFN